MKKKSNYQKLKEKEKKLQNKKKKLSKKEKEAKLKRDIRKLQLENVKTQLKPYVKGVKKAWDWTGKVSQNLVAGEESEKYGISVGMIIRISNGRYSGNIMKIRKIIPGGIQGTIGGNLVNIRHGSYKIPRSNK